MARTLIQSATILTMDDRLGDLADADLLVEGNRIAAIGRDIAASDAQTIDGRGRIVIPGLISAHMHTWQTALRGFAANWTLPEYFRRMHAGLATLFRPDDIYIATLMGARGQIYLASATPGDRCVRSRTRAHTDAARRGRFGGGRHAARLPG